ncbi:TraB/GumN family protein [Haliscomenobacter hydrossis]|uniref:GumN family protein n=1 Tax=Haliscomenobacter hydrossis (strain ATCC 27775 / DSM 1100 / LMG 10767 / O) TaxID=760192 RepID=F4L308_HALH1|nr:TraB/GumN family protein [Haliscomenobacter hydrossis]AEE50667.1 GumN family protein [Haliscomenobacter hydrossis DSM 1100]
MKRAITAVMLVLGCCWVYAQNAAEHIPLEKSLMWEIKGKNLNQASFLYGTIHMIGKKDFFLTEGTKKSFDRAKQVTFEIDMEEMSDIMSLIPLLMQSFMKNDTTLSDLFSVEDYALVEAHFKKIGLPLMFLNRIKPMFLSAMDPKAMAGGDGQKEDIVSYEMEFLEMAQAQKKPVEGLETAAFQMSMFDSIPYKVQAQMLLESIKGGAESSDSQFDQLVEIYKQQDIQAMQEMTAEDGQTSNYTDLLLVNRNRKWIPVMEKMMLEQSTFFAVGAGHLGGAKGVIALLRAAGYTVEPVK